MLGNRLKELRTEKNLSQKQLSSLLPCSSGYISELEQGKKMPGSDVLISLKRALGVNIDWLLTGEGDPYVNRDIDVGSGQVAAAVPAEPVQASNDLELQHIDLVKKFKDKSRAKNANMDLLKIEELDRETFIEIVGYIKGVASSLKIKHVDGSATGGAPAEKARKKRANGQ